MITRSKNIDLMMEALLSVGKNVHLDSHCLKTGRGLMFTLTFTKNVILYIQKNKDLIFYGPRNPEDVFCDLFRLNLKESDCIDLSNRLNKIEFTEDDYKYISWYVFMIVDGKKYISENCTQRNIDTLQSGILTEYAKEY